jgi:flagellin-like protein
MKKKKNFKRHERGRKGLSPVVSTLILIAIVIIIAIIIILWFKVFLKEAVLKEVDGTSKQVEDFCNDVQLRAVVDPDGSIVLTNQGNVPINAINVKNIKSDGSSDINSLAIPLNPGYSRTIPSGTPVTSGYSQLEIVPILLGKTKDNQEKAVSCPQKYAVKI